MDRRPKGWVILAVLVGGFFGISFLVSYYTDWLWFRSLEYDSVFWRMVRARFGSGMIFGAIAAVVVGVNLWIAGRVTRHALQLDGVPAGVLQSRKTYVLIAAVLVFILGNIGASQWPVLLRYIYEQPFGAADPIFNREVGFYVFLLPFYDFLSGFLIAALVLATLVVVVVYVAAGGIGIREGLEVKERPMAHLSALGGVFLLALAWKYRLKIFGLLYSQGRFFGAGYVDVNVQIWAYWLMVIVFLATAVFLFFNVRARNTRLPLKGIGVLVVGTIVVGAVPSTLVQKLVVEPSELRREGPYIKYNIEATNRAYGLDRIVEQPFEASEDLTLEDIRANPLTMRNIRIWDERPLKQTYQQVQEIRPYYVFPNVDVDRYTVDGVYRQVMLSARELDTNRLPDQARNWVNERLQYTHGYGVAMSPVNHVTSEGLPAFMIKDIPPIADSGLEVEQPEIYYGERTYAYIVVKTGIEEFDYPKGDDNRYSTYAGLGGVPTGSFFNRLAFAIRFWDVSLLLSGYILPESRIMFRRQIRERVQTLVPFLLYDTDPYIVASEGRLFWIQDAYTISDMYPYSTRSGRMRINYIRNSVKVVVDAYNGTVTFYQVDTEDPLIRSYGEMFPGLFQPMSAMPEDLKAHVRYPIDLFFRQAVMYRNYHMEDVNVFFNQEDLWEVPNEIYSDQAQPMLPYYIIVKLPGEDREEFLLMVPFTPAKRDNMIAWLAARSDGENYGHLLVYKLPKDKLIYGPMQIEARVDQQPEISSQLTLWGQRGSEVIRGNLLAIPVERSFIYVEPIYLQARQEPEQQGYGQEEGIPGGQPPPRRQQERSSAIPELKQVIVAFGGRVVMRKTFDEALTVLFGGGSGIAMAASEEETPASSVALQTGRSAAELAAKADAHYSRVRSAFQQWDWEQAGKEMKALEETIRALKEELK